MTARPRTPIREDEEDDGSATPALDRGLSVLELLAARRVPLRAIDLAAALAIPKGSLNRILRNLVDRGWLDRDERTMAFSLTHRLLAIGAATVCEKHLGEESLDIMRALRDLTGETVQLNVLVAEQGVSLEVVPSRHPVRLMVDPGSHHNLHGTAPGKVLLAFLPEGERERLLPRLKLTADTERTLTTVEALREDLRRTRERGYGIDREEVMEGVRCVAAPIHDRSGACVAALTVTGPSTRVRMDMIETLAQATIAHAGRIAERLGHHPLSAQAATP